MQFRIPEMNSDFLIIGAGVSGLSVAQALLERGAQVTLIERGACGMESSWAGGGILSPLCPWDYPDAVTRLTQRSAMLFPAWCEKLYADTGIDPEYEISGMMVLPPFDFVAATDWCAAHDMRAMRDHAGALLLPDIAQVRNPRLLRALRRRVDMLGGRIVEHCAMRSIRTSHGKVAAIDTADGEFRADAYVITAGAWSREIMGAYALNLPIKPIRGQMLLFRFDAPPVPHVILQDNLYLIPRRDGHLLVGSTLEDVGFNKETTEAARHSLRSRAEAILPQLHNMPLQCHWAGLRPGSTDNIPAIGRHPHLDNLHIDAGHFRYGVTMAPASVEILLNELDGKPQAFDVSVYQKRWGEKV
jgi:glycine oxidase